MTPLDTVIVGAGASGKDLRAKYVNLLPELRLAAFCDPDLNRARQAAQERGAAGAYASLSEALEAHQPAVVLICSPPEFHLEQTRQALEAGAHVLLEKPGVVSAEQIEELHACYRQSGRKLTLVHNQKFDALMAAAVAQVRAGAVGTVLGVERVWVRNGKVDRMLEKPDHWAHRLPGGRWGETLPHDLYTAYQFLGELSLESVSGAHTHRRWPWLPVDEALISLTNGRAYCTLRFSMEYGEGLHRHTLITGTEGALLVDDYSVRRITDRPAKSPLRESLKHAKSLARWAAGRGKRVAGRVLGPLRPRRGGPSKPRSGQFQILERFVRHVAYDEPQPVPWEEAANVMALTVEAGGRLDALADRG